MPDMLGRMFVMRRARDFTTSRPPTVPSPFVSKVRNLAQRFWTWTCTERPTWRESKIEAAVMFTVFGITGSTSVALVRPTLKNTIGLEGSWKEGPWSYRIGSLVLVSPVYAVVLIAVGTAFGRHRYFANQARGILGRFVPSSVKPNIVCKQAAEAKKKQAV